MNKLIKTEELVLIKKNNAYTTSKIVSEYFDKKHQHVIRDIEDLDCSREFWRSNFGQSNYKDNRGKTQPMYEIKKDGLVFLVMGYRGSKASELKEKYIKQFNKMEKLIDEILTPEWQQQRLANKITRKLETDQIKVFVNYAKEHGSKNADRYYTLFSKLANKYADISNRDFSDFKKLKNLEMIENVINKEIIKLVSNEVEYHVAYNTIKNKVIMISEYF